MIINVLFTVLVIFAGFIILRALLELIRYCFKMIALGRAFKKLEDRGAEVECVRKLSKTAFGKKGKTNFLVESDGKVYDVAVLSFPTTRGRWNIEKAADGYYIEVRVYNKLFFNVYNNTGAEPEHSKDFRRETRIVRKRLHLSSENSDAKKILLVYPKPRALTYTYTKFEYIRSGDKLFGYTVLYDKDFFDMLFS